MKSIFVSSTFRDFHRERDLLWSKIVPRVNNIAKEYGEFVNICDLRWGVDTTREEEPDRAVLSVCLNEIDRSRPYMLVFLGERYGYVPEKEHISEEIKKRGIELEKLEISVTQLEIEYGAFKNQETLSHTWFYFRENESSPKIQGENSLQEQQNQEKLLVLKKRIQKLAGDRIRYYKVGENPDASYDELCQMIQKDLIEGFVEKWEKYANMSLYEKDNEHQWSYLREKALHFKAGLTFGNDLITLLEGSENDEWGIILNGSMGRGKSTCFSFVCREMKNKGWDVLPVLCGNTVLSTDETGILKHIVWMLEKMLNLPHLIEEKTEKEHSAELYETKLEKDTFRNSYEREEIVRYQERLMQLCGLYQLTEGNLLIAVDGIDQLVRNGNFRDLLFIPKEQYRNIKVFLTTTEQVYKTEGISVREIPIFSDEDKKLIIDQILYDNGKQLSSTVYEALFEKETSSNPLFLYLAVNNLCMMLEKDYQWMGQYASFMDGTNRRQINLIENFPDDLGQLAAKTLQKGADIINSKGVERCIDYIAVSRYGFRSVDLEQLLKKEGLRFVPLHFSQLIHIMNELHTLRQDGRWDFLHRVLREGILSTLDDTKKIHRNIAEYLLALPENDPIRQQELYYHLIQADMGTEYIIAAAKAYRENWNEEKYIMEELFRECMKNHDQWFMKLMKESLTGEKSPEFVSDLLEFLYVFFTSGSERFWESKIGIIEFYKISEYTIKLLENFETDYWNKDYWYHVLALGYGRLGKNLERMEQPEAFAGAEYYYDQAIRIREKKVTEFSGVFQVTELAIAYMEKGDWLKTKGDENSRNEALAMYEHARKLMRIVLESDKAENYERNYALLCNRIGYMYEIQESQEAILKALDFYREGEEILRRLTLTYDSRKNSLELARVLCKIGNSYVLLEGNENFEKAIAKYQEAHDLVINAYDWNYCSDCADRLVDILYRMAFIYAQKDEKQALLQAWEIYEKAFRMAYEASIRGELNDNIRDMIRIGHGLAETSLKLQENKYLEKGLEYVKKASEYSRILVSTNRTMGNIVSLVSSLRCEGELYEAMDTEASLKRAKKLYLEAWEQVQELKKSEYDMIKTGDTICHLLQLIGQIYERAGGSVNYKKALPYYEEAMELDEKALEFYGSSPSRLRSLEISCNKVGNILMRLKDKHSLKRAKQLVERALQLAEKLVKQTESDKYWWDLSFCYNLYATVLWKLEESIDTVKDYSLKVFEIRKRLDDKQSTLSSKKSLAASYEKLAIVFGSSDDYHDQICAANYAEKNYRLQEEVLESVNTTKSKRDLANSYMLAAEQYIQLSGAELKYVLLAQNACEKCLSIWNTVVEETNTCSAYLECITAYFRSAQLALRMKQHSKAENYFETLIVLAEKFFRDESETEYRWILADIYMQIIEFYKGKKDATELDREKRFYLYKKTLEIYDTEKIDFEEPRNISNWAAICYSIAAEYLEKKCYDEAIMYFKRNIDITLQITEEKRDQQRSICLYDSYSQMGAIYIEREHLEEAIKDFQKAVEYGENAVRNIKNQDSLPEIVEDLVNNTMLLATICYQKQQLKTAQTSYDKAINFLMILIKMYPEIHSYGEKLLTACMTQLQIKYSLQRNLEELLPYWKTALGLMKKYPGYEEILLNWEKKLGIQVEVEESEIKDVNQELKNLYERAEYYILNGKAELGIQTFHAFQQQMDKRTKEELCDQIYIYQYSMYNHISAYYANKNTQEGYKEAIYYLELTVQKENEALEVVKSERYEEILNDICEDCAHAIALCHHVGEFQKAGWFYDENVRFLMCLATVKPDKYEILLANKALESAAFKMKYLPEAEGSAELLSVAYALSLKHPELDDMQKLLEKIIKK